MKVLKFLFKIIIVLFAATGLFLLGLWYSPYVRVDFMSPQVPLPFTVEAPYIPDSLSFAGEEVPLHLPDVYERMDEELLRNTYFHSSTIMLMKRSAKYLPEITKLLKEHNIPEDFKYLPIIESSLNPRAVSPSKAVGFWQFLSSVGRQYGLRINKYVDERRSVHRSTLAAIKLLKDYHKIMKNWTLTAAAYNRGVNGLRRDMAKQKMNDYYKLYLNRETSHYVFRLLAIKLIMENPLQYSFLMSDSQLYKKTSTKTITVTKTIPNLVQFAHEHKTSYRMIKWLNPWLIDNKLIVGEKQIFIIKLPWQ